MSETVKNTLMVRMGRTTRRNELKQVARFFKEKTERILDDSLPILIRIEAIKGAEEAIRCAVHCASDNGLEVVVHPHADNYFKGLIRVGRMPMSEKSLCSVLEHIRTAFCSFDLLETADGKEYVNLADSYITEVYALTIETLIKFRTKFDILKMCDSILENISESERVSYRECKEIVEPSGLIPILANMITTYSMYEAISDTNEKEKPASVSNEGTIGTHALNILSSVIDNYYTELRISTLVEAAFPVFHCVLDSNDSKILEFGSSVIRSFLHLAGKKTISLRFTNGKTGLQYVLLVAAHILNFSNACDDSILDYDVSWMMEELQETVGDNFELGEGLNTLLKFLLNMPKHCAGENKFTHHRLRIFSYLIQIDCKAVINFLSDSAGPSGQNSLRNVIVDRICRKYESFTKWDRKTAKLVLERIYEYGVAHPESQLHGECLEAVRALLLSLDVSDVEGTNVVDGTLADDTDVDVRT